MVNHGQHVIIVVNYGYLTITTFSFTIDYNSNFKLDRRYN
jgi:hypothetical protein